jgi:hypothetical protein
MDIMLYNNNNNNNNTTEDRSYWVTDFLDCRHNLLKSNQKARKP